jgi:hypothetical protein
VKAAAKRQNKALRTVEEEARARNVA